MRKIFNSDFRVTQVFNDRPDYYKQFGLKGHEGLDLVPTSNDWSTLCLEDGVVVLDDDDVGSVIKDPYGKIVTVWHPSIKKATMYCHLTENYVSQGQLIKRGEKIGKMGATGNVKGAHLHLNLFDVDDNGARLNRNNGYLGGIDPLPFLNEDITSQQMSKLTQAQEDQLRGERDTNHKIYLDQVGQTNQARDRIAILEGEAIKKDETITKLNEDLQKCLVRVDDALKVANQANKEDLNAVGEGLDAQHLLEPYKQALNLIVEGLALPPESTPDQIYAAVMELKDSKTKYLKMGKLSIWERVLFVLTN